MSASIQHTSTPGWSLLTRLALLALAAALAVMAGIGHWRAGAESPPQFTNMAVSVMPEYDQPRVLVSYRGDLNADTAFPLPMRLLLPADSSIESVCSIKQPGEEHICQQYSADPDGEYLAVSWEATTPTMYVELYYSSVAGAGQRSLDFDFWPPYPIDNLDLFVLEPVDATEFTLSPAAAETVEEEGIRHHLYSFQNLSVDEPVSIQMSYTRPTDQPSAPPRATTAADDSSSIPQSMVLILGVAAAAVLAFVLYVAFGRRFRNRLIAVSGRAPRGDKAAAQEDMFFCRQCGVKASRQFAFCPACGQEMRPPPEEQE